MSRRSERPIPPEPSDGDELVDIVFDLLFSRPAPSREEARLEPGHRRRGEPLVNPTTTLRRSPVFCVLGRFFG